jgi:hypothetical protein
MSVRVILRVILCVLVAIGLARPVRAEIMSLRATPPYPTVGTGFLVQALDNGLQPFASSLGWTYQITAPGLAGTPITIGAGVTQVNIVCPMPGYYNVLLVATYKITPFVTTAASYAITAGVSPPTGVAPLSGLGAQASYKAGAVPVVWKIMAGSAVAGPKLGGLAQERLYNIVFWGGSTGKNTGWGPSAPGPNFILNAGQLTDVVQYTADTAWSKIPVGGTLLSYDQDLQIVYSFVTAGGDVVPSIFSLGTLHWTMVKTSVVTFTVKAG